MRLLGTLMTVAFAAGLLVFLYYNSERTVAIQLGATFYPQVPVFLVVMLTALATILFVGIIAVAEGANIRLANRRLRKEIQQLETELTYLRTQPASTVAPDAPAATTPAGTARRETAEQGEPQPEPPSAPVYDTDDDWSSGDDDIYSGGRAV